jgi:hypothetical protein
VKQLIPTQELRRARADLTIIGRALHLNRKESRNKRVRKIARIVGVDAPGMAPNERLVFVMQQLRDNPFYQERLRAEVQRRATTRAERMEWRYGQEAA